MAEKLFCSSLYRNDTIYILAETRKEATEKLKKFYHYTPEAKWQMTGEEKKEMGEIISDLTEYGGGLRDIATLLAKANNNLVVMPRAITFASIWEKYFNGKFFYGEDIEKMKAQKEILDKAEKYERLKEKLTKLGKRISEGEVDFCI